MFASLRGPRRGGWSVSLRAFVTAALLVVLLPLLAHAVVVTWYSYSASREWAERDLLGDAEHLADDVDSRLDAARSVMQVIAVSPGMRRGDLEAVSELFESARAAGLIRAAVVTDTQGAVVTATGFRGSPAAVAPGGSPEQLLAGRVEGEPVLTGAFPVRSADARLARLEFAVSVAVLRAARGGGANWPWHVKVVTDSQGDMVWSAQSTMGPALLRQILDPSTSAGVVPDWAAPDGVLHTIGYARAPRSGLTVVVAQPSPGLYERVPLGEVGAIMTAIGVALLSLAMARLGAVQISTAYQAAIRGTLGGPVRIEDAVLLGAELRRSRDRLFQATGGIAVAELTRPPGRGWEEAEIEASANLRALMELAPSEALTLERLARDLTPEDRAALAETLAGADGQGSVFTRLVRTQREGHPARYHNLVGMLREAGADGGAQLVLTLQDVTAQKQTELELQAQASRLLLATEIAGLGVWERDPVNRTGMASDRLWQIMGRAPRGEITVESFFETVHPDDRERVEQAFRVRLPHEHGGSGAPAAQLRYRIVRPDGSVRHVRSSRFFMEDPGGHGTRVVGVLIDETEAVMAQRALAASEARFRLAVDVAELGVFERHSDPHRYVGVWNERMWRMRGLAPRAEPMGYDELVGMIHPDDRPRIVAAMQDRRGRGDGRTDYEFRIIRPDGEERVIQSRSVRTYDAEDKTVSTVAINIDMTERRRAEQALAESAARFQLAVETAELGFAQLDPATGKGLWSDRLFRIYGLAPRAERPSVEEILALVHPDDRERVAETMSRQRVGTDGDVVETEFRIVRPDGEERILQVRSVRLRGADGTETLSTVTLDVTERRRAEQALAESEARLRLAVDTAGLGVAELNMGTGQGFWNDRLYRICGLEPDGGRPALPSVLALVHPADRDRISQAVAAQRAGEGGDVVELNFRLLRPDGEERVLEVRSTVLRQAGRETLLTVTHDITEQRHAAQALADSEMRFRLAVETAGLGVVDRNLATGEGDWSPQMWRIMGMEAGAHPLGKEESLSIVHPDDRALVEEIRARHAAGKVGDTNEYEFRMMRPDGQVRMLHARSVTLRGADGSPRLLAVNQDVTEQRRAEQALADSELRFRLAVETAELGVADRNLATGEGSWSDQMCRIMGFEPGAQPLGSAETLALVHPEDRALIEGMRARHAAGQVGDIHEFEYRMMRPDGQVRILHARSVTLRAADGAPRLLAVNQDVTERRRAEQALADSELRLRLATAAAGVGIWDHDPATGITVWTDEMFRLRGLPVAESVPPREVLLDLVVEQDRALLDAAWERLKAGEPDVRYDYRVRWPDGTLRHLRSEGRALHDEAGRVVRLLGMVTDVTAEREAAIALLDRTTTLELAIEAADLGIWMREPGETTRIASARLWEMVGHPGREGAMTREELLACLHPDDRAAVLREWVLANDEPFPRQREFRAIWPDGTVRHFQSRRAVMRDAAGRSPRVVGLIADVTEARRSAAALEASEARLRLAVETAGLGVFDIDPVTRAGHWSERMWRMRGLEPRPGKPGIEETLALLHPEDRDRALAHTRGQAVLAEGELSEFEVRVVWPDGSVHHIQSRSIAQRGVDGTVKRIFGINQDVTESGAAAQALAEAAARYELAVDAAEMGVFEFDPETRTGYWSERIWRMRGLEPRPGTLSFQEVIDLVHPEDREPVAARMREQFAGPDGMRGEYEFRIVRPDGAVRYLQSRAITQRRPDGGLHRLFGINIDVTERRLAAQALEESEARLRLASEAAELGVFQVNIPDGTGHWSERMWHIRGLAPRPGLPDSALAVATVHPDDRALVSGLREAAAGWAPGESVRRQFRVIWPDGSLRHVASYAVALHGRENGGFSLIGVNLDITEQVVREQALRETAARFELAIDAAGLAVWDWDPATDRMTWSPRMWALLGVPPRDEVPDAEARLWAVLPEDRDRVPAVWIRRAGGEASERGEDEFRILRPDGSLRYFRWQGTPLRDAEGRIVRFAGVVADVTEARLADLALRTSEELFRMAAEAAEQGVWNYDLVTDTTTWSAQLWRIHGLPPQEGAPAREDRIAFLHPEDREEVLGLFDKLLSSAPNTVMRQSFRILRVDGAVRMLERQSMVVTGADGRPARIVGVVHDVTDAREQAAQTMVADKLATLGEMAGAIAHELAQPLQAVIATAATARMRLAQAVDEATVEKVSDRLAWIEKQTSRAGKTIQHLLAFSRGESSAGLCRLADALEGAMELAGHGLRRDGVEVLVEMPANLPPVRGGQVEIEQVLVNLLNNARDAMAESRSRRIRIEARHEGDSIRLDVADTGNGVPADKMQRIFEPFYTTKPIGRGTGIGLSVARRTMQALGGGISVANNGTGACFSLTFRNAATDG